MIFGTAHIRLATLADFDQTSYLISEAHRGSGEVSERYAADTIRLRLNQIWAFGGEVLLTEQDGAIIACGALSPVAFARDAWAMSFGATRSDMQGRGLGHALVEKRLQLAAEKRAGTIMVSSRNAARWRRYGFKAVNVNPITGASLMVINLDWRS
jgi:predicted N-acetyltransferase YhbS